MRFSFSGSSGPCRIGPIQQSDSNEDGDYGGTVEALVAAGAPTRFAPPTGNDAVDALLTDR